MSEELFAGRYRLGEKLGAGAMSEVWSAEDVELERPVALKLLAPNADTERFGREARAVAALAHPSINQLYDYGEVDGRPYMVLECLRGGSLEDRLAAGRPLADTETAQIAREVAAGLAHAHAHGLVHRDLKPANVLFDSEGRAKIADFGIARVDSAATLTEAGTVLGTATTISPEQAAGLPATPASDVYSFGVVLFWMLTGRPPFTSDRPLELLTLHRDAEPPTVTQVRRDAPAALSALAGACLAKDPDARPADGSELVRELAPTSATATLPLVPPTRRRRLPTAALAGVVLAALAAAGVAVAFVLVHEPGSPPAATTATSAALPTVSTATPTTAPTTTGTTQTTTAASTAPATRPATTHAVSTAVTRPPPIATTTATSTSLYTTTNVTTTEPPPTGTTTVGSGP